MIIAASERNDCQFCTGSHCDLVRIAGIVDEDPLALVGDPAALGAARAGRRPVHPRRDGGLDRDPAGPRGRAKERFSDPELVELTFLIGYINMLNLFNNCLDVRYNGEYALLTTPGSPAPAPQAATG